MNSAVRFVTVDFFSCSRSLNCLAKKKKKNEKIEEKGGAGWFDLSKKVIYIYMYMYMYMKKDKREIDKI